jgi:hypothetical protein
MCPPLDMGDDTRNTEICQELRDDTIENHLIPVPIQQAPAVDRHWLVGLFADHNVLDATLLVGRHGRRHRRCVPAKSCFCSRIIVRGRCGSNRRRDRHSRWYATTGSGTREIWRTSDHAANRRSVWSGWLGLPTGLLVNQRRVLAALTLCGKSAAQASWYRHLPGPESHRRRAPGPTRGRPPGRGRRPSPRSAGRCRCRAAADAGQAGIVGQLLIEGMA